MKTIKAVCKKVRLNVLTLFAISLYSLNGWGMPAPGFVYLKDIDPTILQEIRYYSNHNFVGRRISGYEQPTCILTKQTAIALKEVQDVLRKQKLSLKVYDCYRPTNATQDFLAWSKNPSDQKMKQEFYPRTSKEKLFKLGYIAEQSGHSRGSTVDLTIVDLKHKTQATYHAGEKLVSCYLPKTQRFDDNSLDMGTGYDCLDVQANTYNPLVKRVAMENRLQLSALMTKHGFIPYEKEWWHFTLKNEPFPKTYFSFPVQ